MKVVYDLAREMDVDGSEDETKLSVSSFFQSFPFFDCALVRNRHLNVKRPNFEALKAFVRPHQDYNQGKISITVSSSSIR